MEKSQPKKKRFVVGGGKKKRGQGKGRGKPSPTPSSAKVLAARLAKAEEESSMLFKDLLKLKRKVNAAKARSVACVNKAAASPVRQERVVQQQQQQQQPGNGEKRRGKGKGKGKGKVVTSIQNKNKNTPNIPAIAAVEGADGAGPDITGVPPPRAAAAATVTVAGKAKDYETADTLIKKHRTAELRAALSAKRGRRERNAQVAVRMAHSQSNALNRQVASMVNVVVATPAHNPCELCKGKGKTTVEVSPRLYISLQSNYLQFVSYTVGRESE